MTPQEIMIRMLTSSLIMWLVSTVKNAASKKRLEKVAFELYSMLVTIWPQFAGTSKVVVKASAEKSRKAAA